MHVIAEQESMTRRQFIAWLATGAAAAVLPFACSREQGDAASSQPTVYTRANPGKWAGKEDAHEPQAAFTRLDDEGNYRVDVVANHDMSPVHWISHISLRDQDGRLLGEKSLLGTDAKADASFRINTAGLTTLKAYGLCNLHGLWLHEYPLPA